MCGLARDGVGTRNIDVTDTRLSRASPLPHGIVFCQGNREQPSRLFFYAYAFWLEPAKRTGPSPLVFVHGTPFSSYVWHRIAPHFFATHRVHYFDLPGYGRSEQPDADVSLGVQNELLWGEEDRWISIERGRELHKMIPGSLFHPIRMPAIWCRKMRLKPSSRRSCDSSDQPRPPVATALLPHGSVRRPMHCFRADHPGLVYKYPQHCVWHDRCNLFASSPFQQGTPHDAKRSRQ